MPISTSFVLVLVCSWITIGCCGSPTAITQQAGTPSNKPTRHDWYTCVELDVDIQCAGRPYHIPADCLTLVESIIAHFQSGQSHQLVSALDSCRSKDMHAAEYVELMSAHLNGKSERPLNEELQGLASKFAQTPGLVAIILRDLALYQVWSGHPADAEASFRKSCQLVATPPFFFAGPYHPCDFVDATEPVGQTLRSMTTAWATCAPSRIPRCGPDPNPLTSPDTHRVGTFLLAELLGRRTMK